MAETEQVLYELKGRMQGIEHQLSKIAEDLKESRKESSDSRRRMYEQIDSLKHDAAESRLKIESVAEDLAENKPVFSEIKRWKERFIGMQMLLGAGAAVIGGGLVIFWKWIGAKLGIS